MRYKTFSIILIIILLATVTGCAIFDGARMLSNSGTETAASPTPILSISGMGDTCERTPWRIKLTGKDHMKSIGQAPLDTVAQSGNTLLILYFDVTNISETNEYFNYIYFKAEADGHKAELILPATNSFNEHDTAIGTVGKGKTAAYYVVYEVPEDWKIFKISYDIGGMTENVFASFEIKT